jgi:hypothetical protein
VTQAVSRLPVTAETRVWSRAVCVKYAVGKVQFFSENFGFLLSLLFHMCSILIIVILERAKRGNVFRISESLGHIRTSHKVLMDASNFRMLRWQALHVVQRRVVTYMFCSV